MEKVKEWPNTIVAVTPGGLHLLVGGDPELIKYMDGDMFEDNSPDLETFPTEPGVYVGTVEYWFQQGYFEGYPADGESDIEYAFSDYRKIDPLGAAALSKAEQP
jgi:hypothetical protein